MSKAIDQRIVEMSFENHKFEKGINQSKNSLKEFSNALNNMGNGKDFRGLENSVNSISTSFSMLEQIGIGALRRIGESAVNAGASLVKSLTIDQLSAGLDKYQQKIEAVQTMVSAGYDLEEVEKSMEQLMWFSDETSYSFADMANNMGKFISAGVDLKTSEKAMQGIATWAAHSGKNSQAASIAMFNLSQAISLGYVDTMNWRSIMNQNMNTKMFKEIAIGVAETTGAIKEGQVTIQNFDSNLKSKWFTNDVLTKTLEQYAGYAEKVKEVQDEMGFDTAAQAMDYMDAHADQYSDVINQIGNAAFKASQESKSFMDSINATMDAVSTGWMKTYEIIFGTLYEAKANFSALTEVLWTVFASSAETRNEMLQLIKDGGGIKGLFKTIKNVAVALLTPLKAISQAFDQFFPPKTAEQWIGIIATLERVTKSLIMSEETAKKIQRTFAGFFAVVDIGWETVKFLGSSLLEIVSIFIPLNGNLLETTATIGDFLVELNRLIKQSGVFQYGLLGIKIAAMIVKDTLTNVVSKISEFVYALWTADEPLKFIGQAAQGVFTGILDTLKTVVTWISGKFKNSVTSVFTFLSKGLNLKDGSSLGELLKTLKEFIEFIITEATGGLLDFGGALDKLDFNRIATFVSGGILLLFVNQLTNLTKSMNGLVTTTNSFVTKFSKKLFGTTTKIKDLAFVFGVLSASLYVLSEIPWDKMKVGLAGLSGALLLFVGAYGAVQAITVAGSKALNGVEVIKSAISLKALAAGMIGMTIALKQISKISEYDVWRSVGVLGALMGLVVAYQALSAVISRIPKQTKLLTDFGGVALGLATLVGVIAVLQLLTPEIISSGLTKLKGIMEVLMVLQIAFAVAALIGGGNKLSTNLFGISAGILALVGVIKILSELNISEMSKGIENVFLIGGILSAIQLMFSLAARISGGNKFKASIFSMTVGLVAMVALLAIMDSVGQKKLQNGIETLIKMAGIIAGLEILTAVAARIGGGHKLQSILGSVTIAMLSFTALIAIIGNMEQETIDKGLTTIKKMVAIILAFQGVVALTAVASKGFTGGGLAAITGMVAGVLTVTAALILLSMQDQTALANAAKSLAMTVAAVGIMSTGIGLMIKSLSGLSTGLSGFRTIISKLLPGLAAMGIVLLATFALIELIKASSIADVSWNDLGKIIVGMGALTALATAFTILAKVPGLASGRAGLATLVPGLGGMVAVVLATAGLFEAISWVLDDIKDIEWSDLAMFTVGLALVGAMALGIGALSKPLAALGPLIVPVLGGVLAAIGGVALIVLGFALLADVMELFYGNNPDTLIKGFDLLALVGEGIGRFLGSIASGFNKEIIIGYGEGLAGFAAAMSTIEPSSFDGVESLARALLILTGTSLIDGLARFVNFGKNPGEVFGEQISGMIKSLSGITAEEATNTANIFRALLPMMGTFERLITAVGNIPNEGGMLAWFAGNNNIDEFGREIKRFINYFSLVDITKATHVTNVFSALAPMMGTFEKFITATSRIPNEGGMLAWFAGNNNIDEFGREIKRFINYFSLVDITKATHVTNVFSALAPMMESFEKFTNIATMIPNEGGRLAWFTGNNNIDNFGDGIVKMVQIFNGVSASEVTTAATNIKLMADGMLPNLNRFITLTDRLVALGGNWDQSLPLLNLATTLKEFVRTLKGVDVSVVIPALKSLEDINASFEVMGAEVLASAKASFDNNTQPFQTSIVTFLVGIIKEVDGRKGDITRSFSTIFTEALMVSKSYITQFKTLGSDIIKGLKQGIDQETPIAENAINKVVQAITTKTKRGFQINSPSKVFEGIGKWLPVSLGRGIERNAKTAILASVNMGEAVEEAFRNTTQVHSETPIYKGIGAWMTKSVGSGMENFKGGLLKTAEKLGLDTTDMTIKGVIKGLVGGESELTKVATSLIDTLSGDSSTINKVAESLGFDVGESFDGGYSDALNSGKGAKTAKGVSTKIAKDAFEIFKEGIDKRKKYNMITIGEELAEWENFSKQYVAGTEIRLKADLEVARVRAELQSKEFNNSKRWIEEEKYYKRLSLLEELEAWNRVQRRYEEGHAYRIEAEKEMFRLKQEIQKDEYDNAKNWIDEEKYYKRLSLRDELAAWTAIQQTYAKGTENRKNADREVFRLQEEISEKRKSLEDDYYKKTREIKDKLKQDIADLEKSYTDAIESRAKSLYDSYRLFDGVQTKDPVDGTKLLTNLSDQVAAFATWQQSIRDLGNRGISAGLMDELEAMGPDAVAEIQALNSLTDEQLNQYVNLWQQKHQLAKQQATIELQDMRISTNEQIKLLQSETAKELKSLEKIFDKSMREIANITNTQVQAMKAQMDADIKMMNAQTKAEFMSMQQDIKAMGWTGLGEEIVNSVETGVIAQAESLAQATIRAAQNALNAAMKAIGGSPVAVVPSKAQGGHNSMLSTKDFKAKYSDEIAEMARKNNVDLSTGEAMLRNEIYKNGDEAIKALQKTSKSTSKVMKDVGDSINEGLIKGMTSSSPSVIKTVSSVASTVINTAKKVLGIKSPSTEFFELGIFSMEGFVNGLMNQNGSIENATKNLANMALDSLVLGLSGIDSLLDDDTNPVITPILDLTNIENGSRKIGELFNTKHYNLSPITSKDLSLELTPQAKPKIDRKTADTPDKHDPSFSFVQHNYSPKALSRIEIYRQTKNQLSAMKGVVKA